MKNVRRFWMTYYNNQDEKGHIQILLLVILVIVHWSYRYWNLFVSSGHQLVLNVWKNLNKGTVTQAINGVDNVILRAYQLRNELIVMHVNDMQIDDGGRRENYLLVRQKLLLFLVTMQHNYIHAILLWYSLFDPWFYVA